MNAVASANSTDVSTVTGIASSEAGAIAAQLLADPVKSKLLHLLANGVSQGAAALATGVSDGYVSQLMMEQDFLQTLAGLRSRELESAIAHDAKVESLEEKVLAVLEKKLPYVKNAVDAARIFVMLNNAKKRNALPGTEGYGNEGASGMQQVNITLPKAAAVQINMNSNNQVIDVGGKSMATLPSKALPALATRLAEKKKELANADATRAADLLAAMKPMETVIDGVVKVL
jgi:hypothetical protein